MPLAWIARAPACRPNTPRSASTTCAGDEVGCADFAPSRCGAVFGVCSPALMVIGHPLLDARRSSARCMLGGRIDGGPEQATCLGCFERENSLSSPIRAVSDAA